MRKLMLCLCLLGGSFGVDAMNDHPENQRNPEHGAMFDYYVTVPPVMPGEVARRVPSVTKMIEYRNSDEFRDNPSEDLIANMLNDLPCSLLMYIRRNGDGTSTNMARIRIPQGEYTKRNTLSGTVSSVNVLSGNFGTDLYYVWEAIAPYDEIPTKNALRELFEGRFNSLKSKIAWYGDTRNLDFNDVCGYLAAKYGLGIVVEAEDVGYGFTNRIIGGSLKSNNTVKTTEDWLTVLAALIHSNVNFYGLGNDAHRNRVVLYYVIAHLAFLNMYEEE